MILTHATKALGSQTCGHPKGEVDLNVTSMGKFQTTLWSRAPSRRRALWLSPSLSPAVTAQSGPVTKLGWDSIEF